MFRNALVLCSIILLLSSGCQIFAPQSIQGLEIDRLAAIDTYIEGLVAERKISGAVAYVSRSGESAYLKAFGHRDAETSDPMQTDTLFRICSMTKPITSLAIMILEEEGRLSVDDPLSKFIPAFKNVRVLINPTKNETVDAIESVPAETEITIHHLLTHTSGLTYGFLAPANLKRLYELNKISDGLVETPGTTGDNARRLAAVPLLTQPGADWNYGLSTDVLGYVVEVTSGMTLAEFLKERIFEPLGMKDTFFYVPEEKAPRLATVYQPKTVSSPGSGDESIEPIPPGVSHFGGATYSTSYNNTGAGSYFSGGGGLVSTVEDYARFLSLLLGEGEIDGVRIIAAEAVRRMTGNQIADLDLKFRNHGDKFGYGFGVVTTTSTDEDFLGNVGTYSWGGFYDTYFWVDPERQLIGIVMAQLYPSNHVPLRDTFRKLTYAALEED